MLVLVDENDQQPLVAQIGRPGTEVVVTDQSKHHITVRLDEGPAQFHLVLTREIAALLVARLLPLTAPNVAWLQQREKGSDGHE
ncbi:hypothetical protein [Kutzneria sp. NPDC052558]|uniref:hypothetical protein n=1 Tax=Kutzneria sp. NPDC052558 TaxID=3364121 RepID=UPI0037C6F89E